MLALLIVLGLVALFVLVVVLPTMPIALRVYNEHLVRRGRENWRRGVCSFPDDAEMVEMYRQGALWHDANADCCREVGIVSDGLKLAGEYYDFGFRKAAMVLSGRTETLTYGYFFAAPYRTLGYNVLLIDDRGHGDSEGDRNNVGLKEFRDVQRWVRFLHDELGNEKVLLHGICIGAATAMYTVTEPGAPDCVEGLVVDGMYTTFRETFRTHMKLMKRPVFPVLDEVMLLIALHAGRHPGLHGPVYSIRRLKLPVLMLFGRQDQFSLPEKSRMLYEMCPSRKQVVWFERGAHSHLRINAPEQYDGAIGDFVRTL